MNFNILVLLLFVFSCGVKSPPRPPNGTDLPPIIDEVEEKLKKKKQ